MKNSKTVRIIIKSVGKLCLIVISEGGCGQQAAKREFYLKIKREFMAVMVTILFPLHRPFPVFLCSNWWNQDIDCYWKVGVWLEQHGQIKAE